MAEPERETRAHYRHFLAIPTRWMDNDVYGHLNNVAFAALFDQAFSGPVIKQRLHRREVPSWRRQDCSPA